MFTPWGAPIETCRFEPGITGVRTEKSGGLMLARGYAERFLTSAARSRAIRFGEYYSYAIDNAWAIPAIELVNLSEALTSFCRPELRSTTKQSLHEILAVHHPDYLMDAETKRPPVQASPVVAEFAVVEER